MLVHLQSSEILQGYVLRQATFDVSLVRLISRSDLPTGWRRNPSSAATRRVGDEWAASGISAALQVPSAIVPIENNFLFNPNHPDFALIEWGRQERYRFDPRLAGR